MGTPIGSVTVPIFKIIVAVVIAVILIRLGLAMLRALATPIPDPPDPGELRKVRLHYRCSLCGTEVRMTIANDQEPDPPRHCMEEMDLLTTED
ncbi:MAG: hypothetical protein DSY73_01755 [Actinobacteria bacterium]|nr:MAG: hypothetical protein DSY73_01755 [Actinomycetota bacterium]